MLIALAAAALIAQEQPVPGWQIEPAADGCTAFADTTGGAKIGIAFRPATDRVAMMLYLPDLRDAPEGKKEIVRLQLAGSGGDGGAMPMMAWPIRTVDGRRMLVGDFPSEIFNRLRRSEGLSFRVRGIIVAARSDPSLPDLVTALRSCAHDSMRGRNATSTRPPTSRALTPQAQAAVAARPIEQARWLTAADYPRESKARGESGTVRYRLAIGADGRSTGCAIVQPTRFWRLDTTTCRLLRERARFVPARDAAGQPTAADYTGEFTWRRR